ncbi:MAG: NADH-quinone oxidoreductase subunit F, partial [Chloroflexi bacterium]|nr:NADH-quinone oxidoreductase subunit F [Chloroflexota bacterium]
MAYYRSTILVSMDPICVEKGALQIKEQIIEELKLQKILDEVQILDSPRIGDPEIEGPDILVYPEGSHYISLTPESVRPLVVEHFIKGRELAQYSAKMRDLMDEEIREPKDKEVRVILENIGKIDPRNIEDYIATDGYAALAKVLTEMTPEDVIQTILDSKLRGRGGAGFPTGLKWKFARQAQGSPKFMVCNADEGDPGAFMNRKVLEGDPHSVIEGMAIGAYAVGSTQG